MNRLFFVGFYVDFCVDNYKKIESDFWIFFVCLMDGTSTGPPLTYRSSVQTALVYFVKAFDMYYLQIKVLRIRRKFLSFMNTYFF
jgi:hypothetical protein